MKLIYIAGPYSSKTSAGVQENIHRAWRVALMLMKAGYATHCPHLNTLRMDGELEYEDFMDIDFEVISRCDGIFLVEGWHHSPGTLREIAFAKERDIPVYEDLPQLRVADLN